MFKTGTIEEILKKGFLEQQEVARLNLTEVLAILTVTLLIGLFIFAIYRLTFDGVLYSHRFNASILMISLITSLIIMTIHSNIILSLGMVGALSIVRFRTALKEPMDIVYMFWAIAVGITTGSGLFYIAVGGSLFIGLVMVLMAYIKTDVQSYLMILNYEEACNDDVYSHLNVLKHKVRSKIIQEDHVELTISMKYSHRADDCAHAIKEVDGVKSVSLVNYEENVF